ncbi:Uncharacterized conserved protein, DUF2126 family [Catalinimonas alkaloidigena]|uniref:Uncharacterized conserved protein, DUF2126 family n=1 Tax=Catalinimonas alkaloidigena TaxID=1075417 RepID=A0A1G9GD14_9BACT|nr:transglutaminase family protein [Catalinimonas alkaloidigena]SDK98173.1 Uncharacterized conserved protein, DUF2126 family [Catalinimonas alkaloidigena]
MAIKVALRHKTVYKYDRLTTLSPHVFRLRPAPHSRTPIESYTFKLSPSNHFINWQQDPFGNYQARVVFPEQTRELSIDVEVVARLEVINPFDFFVEEYAEQYPFRYEKQLRKELVPYLEINEEGQRLSALAKEMRPQHDDRPAIVDFLVKLNQKVNQLVGYTIRMEPGVQACEETLTRRMGSCRDSAWLLVQLLRHLGIAARFVSGYLVQLTADVKSLDGPSGPEADFTDLHAWAEAYIPGAGWIGLDATSGLFAGEGHIPLSCTPHYKSAAPVTGLTSIAEVEFEFENSVRRIFEDPRVTKPYTEQQWAKVLAVGEKVEQDLIDGDVRMTMGGEPTFVSVDDMEAPEWNTRADGPHKRKLAYDLLLRLKEKFGHQGLPHYGQGKWYPGEPFPRWQYSLYWRKDGVPMWHDMRLLASPYEDQGHTTHDAERFMQELARHLGVSAAYALPAYEDPVYWLLKESEVPVNLDPLDVDLSDPVERRKLAENLAHGLNQPVGYVLPLTWSYDFQTWASGRWQFRRKHLLLIPGNSPVGLRLPLESLAYVPDELVDDPVERSLFEDLPEFEASYQPAIDARYGSEHEAQLRPRTWVDDSEEKTDKRRSNGAPEKKKPLYAINVVRTALGIECRNGVLFLFLPPVDYFEHYLDLIASIEATAARLNLPVCIEGYAPPSDYRIQKLMITPDPGVVEVNIHPQSSWQELVQTTDTLYEEAFQARLGTEKFMVDGRHTGTGGGNHVTIGGATPSDSPLLRRPDVLRSLITYWQHHPALSYLFSGAFVGPTSQAPRVDEGRDERLYELEIAFEQIPDGGEVPFWIVDRVFRNLLTDITGNTHRTEFCIDKLYSPDSSAGRLGLLEFRGFDMPPHKHMSLVQMLLIRALVAKFWKQPYKHKLIRWGTELHDRFMLPHFTYLDMLDVVQDLKEAGYDFDISWFDPFMEFRFPRFGTVTMDNIQLELRFGIEPWHVLGEEITNTGTARFVDSSVERVQVKVNGFVEHRHILLCNGCRVPLRATGTKGEYVAGVRYKAWNPPSALHPTIGVDTPLVFDVVDSWNNKVLGGCTYFVSHPGGRNYDTYPINAYEAESRRISRFWDFGHTPEAIANVQVAFNNTAQPSRFMAETKRDVRYDAPIELVNTEFPSTLDLRRFWRRRT